MMQTQEVITKEKKEKTKRVKISFLQAANAKVYKCRTQYEIILPAAIVRSLGWEHKTIVGIDVILYEVNGKIKPALVLYDITDEVSKILQEKQQSQNQNQENKS